MHNCSTARKLDGRSARTQKKESGHVRDVPRAIADCHLGTRATASRLGRGSGLQMGCMPGRVAIRGPGCSEIPTGTGQGGRVLTPVESGEKASMPLPLLAYELLNKAS